jgi:hypothetical protein
MAKLANRQPPLTPSQAAQRSLSILPGFAAVFGAGKVSGQGGRRLTEPAQKQGCRVASFPSFLAALSGCWGGVGGGPLGPRPTPFGRGPPALPASGAAGGE